jgi:hypothetical protein
MDRLGFNGESTMKRLGDGFYEQRMVLDQITSLTGRRYLTDNTDAMAQYRALMDAGVSASGEFQLSVGIALTASQMASLTQDIVWMVSQEVNGEKVLVPVVCLNAGSEQHTWDQTTQKKTSSTFSSKTTRTSDSTDDTYAIGSSIKSSDGVTIAASRDITLQGTQVSSDGAIALAAGRDINLEATHDSYSESHESTIKKSGFVLNHGLAPMQQGKTTDRDSATTQTIAHGTTLSGDSVTAAAGRNIVGEGVQIAATNDVLLAAGSAALGVAVGGATGGSVASSATANNWLLHSEIEKADKAIAECADQACKDNVVKATQALNDLRDMELFEWGRTVQNVAVTDGMSRAEYDNALNLYWSARGLDKNDVVPGVYKPATDPGYIARQFSAGFTSRAKAFPSAVSTELGASLNYLRDRGVSGSIEDLGVKLGGAAQGLSDWFNSPLPSQAIERSIDQYAMTTPFQSGELSFDAATGLATAYVGGKALTWVGGKWIASVSDTAAKVDDESATLKCISGNCNGPDLTGRLPGSVLEKQATNLLADLARQYNDPAIKPRDFTLSVNGKTLSADPLVSKGAPVYSGATTDDVMKYFRQLAGTEDMPQVKVIPGQGDLYNVKVTSGPNAGSSVTLRQFSTSAGESGATWTIDVTTPSINGGRRVEIKFK